MLLPWPCVSPCAYVPTVVSRPSTTRYLALRVKLGTYRAAFIQEKAWDVPRPPAGFPPPLRPAPRRAGAGRRAPSQESEQEAEPMKGIIAALAPGCQ